LTFFCHYETGDTLRRLQETPMSISSHSTSHRVAATADLVHDSALEAHRFCNFLVLLVSLASLLVNGDEFLGCVELTNDLNEESF
jgi:hypothetical protein